MELQVRFAPLEYSGKIYLKQVIIKGVMGVNLV